MINYLQPVLYSTMKKNVINDRNVFSQKKNYSQKMSSFKGWRQQNNLLEHLCTIVPPSWHAIKLGSSQNKLLWRIYLTFCQIKAMPWPLYKQRLKAAMMNGFPTL